MRILLIFSLILISFGLGLAANAYYDLAVTGMSSSVSEPAQNQPINITVTVTNKGEDTVITDDATKSYEYQLGDFELETITTPVISGASPLAPGAQKTYVFTGSYKTVGDKSLHFRINTSGTFDDPRTTNDSLNVKIKVVEPYDLSITGINTVPVAVTAGQKTTIYVTAQNSGYASLWTSAGVSSINYIFPDFTITSSTIPNINSSNRITSGVSFTYAYSGTFSGTGEKELSFTIDTGGQLTEKNENNNNVIKKISVVADSERDLKANKPVISIAKPIVDQEVIITVNVTNSGKVALVDQAGLPSENDYTVYPPVEKGIDLLFTDFRLSEITKNFTPTLYKPLEPGATVQYTIKGVFTKSGTKELKFISNYLKKLPEKDYANNTATTSVYVYENASARDEFQITSHQADMIASKTVSLSWTTNLSAVHKLEYKRAEFTSYTQEWNLGAGTIETQKIEDLLPGKRYEYKITARNNEVERTLTDYFTMPADDTLKISAGPEVLSDTTGSTTIVFTTNLQSLGTVYFRLAAATAENTAVDKVNLSQHALSLGKLVSGEYSYRIEATSTPRTWFKSATYKFTIGNPTPAAPVSPTPSPGTETAAVPAETASASQSTDNSGPITVTNSSLYSSLKGKIILRVESRGEAYYLHPSSAKMYSLGRPGDAFEVMRSQGIGVTDTNLEKIPVGLMTASGLDTDSDGLSDLLEDAIGSDKTKSDTDSDGFSDRAEISGGYNPIGSGSMPRDASFASQQKGKIFLQVESKGEAWYVSTVDSKRYFLGRPTDAFNVMRGLGLGISNSDFDKL